ncbi:MAG: hypothetical protein ACKOUR_18390 [Planctomycetota bacterium]
MSALQFLKNLHLAYLSKPVADRVIYQAAVKHRPKSIVELGVQSGQRTQKLLQRLLQETPAAELRYTGIDLFEARPAESPGLALKQAYALFKPLGIKTQLIPGDPSSALARSANNLRETDLLIISADQPAEALERAWIYVPRMLKPTSLVYWETTTAPGVTTFRLVTADEITALADPRKASAGRRVA